MIERVAFLSMHTSPLSTPGVGDAGGMNVYVDSLSRTLARRGVAVDVFTGTRPGTGRAEVDVAPGYRVVGVPVSPSGDAADGVGEFAEGVIRWSARNGVRHDVVHSHYWMSGWAGLLVADLIGARLAISFHTLGRVKEAARRDGDAPESLLRIAAETEVIARAACVIASTATEAAELVEHYSANPGRVCVSPPGVDHHIFHPGDREGARGRLGIYAGPTVAFVGRIQPLKGVDIAVGAVGSLADVSLLVVGGPSGPRGDAEWQRLTQLAELEAPGRVWFHEPMAHGSVADVYRAVDAVIVPSHAESFGLVAVEAQACGTPVVASRVGGLAHVVADGRTGVLVDGWSPNDYADAITKVLASPEMGRGAVENAARFSWDATADRLLELYAGLDR